MKTKIAVFALVPVIALFASAVFFLQSASAQSIVPQQGTVCTQDAMQCPDGSWVGRSGPNCTFACPGVPVTPPSPATPIAPTPICYELSSNLYNGLTSAQVTELQTFLAAQNYFSGPIIGRYGPLTMRSVINFQGAYGIPATGFVGPLTRAKIQALTCGTNPQPAANVSIYSITPTSGAVGASVTINGSGFTSDNIIHFGGGAIAHVAAASAIFNCPMMPVGSTGGCGNFSQTLTFTVPQSVGPYCAPGMACPMYLQLVTPGTYNVSVQNGNGTSNVVTFTVTGTSPFPVPTPVSSQVSVSGIDAPSTLALGKSGTWTVHATTNNPDGQLHYAVIWGDEMNMANAGMIMMPVPTAIQTSATFTHTYQHSGTYTPMFTVSDDSGASASVSSNVTVTPLY